MSNNIYNLVGPNGFKVSQSLCTEGEDCFYDDESDGWYFKHNNNEYEYFQDATLVQSRNNMVQFFRNDDSWGSASRDCVLGNHGCPHLKRGRLFIEENMTFKPLRHVAPGEIVPSALYVPKKVPWSTVERILDGYPHTITDIVLECKYHNVRCGGSSALLTFGIYTVKDGRHEYHHVSKTDRDAIDGIRSCIAHIGAWLLKTEINKFEEDDFDIPIITDDDDLIAKDKILHIIRHDMIPPLGEHNLTQKDLLQHHDSYGSVDFDEIPDVSTWDGSTYYVWGANVSNYNSKEGTILNEDTIMAGPEGPTHGFHHPMYIGVITTTYMSDGHIEELVAKNQLVFEFLRDERKKGKNIVFPYGRPFMALGFSLSTKAETSEGNLTVLVENFLENYASLGIPLNTIKAVMQVQLLASEIEELQQTLENKT